MLTNPIVLDILGVLARALLSVLSGYLEAKHLITTEQSTKFVDEAVHYVLIGAPAVGAFAWGAWVRYHNRKKLVVALGSEKLMTENEVKALIKSGAVTPTVSTPKDTIPGVPA